MEHLHNRILFSQKKKKKEENFTLRDSMDRLGDYCAQWNKLEKDKCHMISLIYGSNEQTEITSKTKTD